MCNLCRVSEKKIDVIDERLANIEELLKGITLRPSHHNGYEIPSDAHLRRVERSATVPPLSHPGTASCVDEDPEVESSIEGADSSIPANTIFASEFIEVAAQRTSADQRGLNPDVSAALSSLRQIVSLHKRQVSSSDVYRFPKQKDISVGGLSQLPMPPLAATIAEIEKVKDDPPTMYGYITTFMGSEDFRDRCRKVYFRTDDYTCCTYVIVNAALYYLFRERHYTADEEEARNIYRDYYQMCQTNLETALGNMPMFLPAHCETVEALHLGALYCIEISRPSLAWQLMAKAADICRVLGYHKKPTSAASSCYFMADGTDMRALMFWQTYVLDSCLSLRMGRPPAIQEWDIEIAVEDMNPGTPQASLDNPWGKMVIYWVHHATIQNKLYKYLYSPAALSQPREEHENWARRLSKELTDLSASAAEAREATLTGLRSIGEPGFMELHVLGDEVTFYSTITLAYRAIPAPEGSPSRFCQECIDAARLTMRAHQHCMSRITQGDHLKAVYVHWAIMLTPFAPFFVLLCHVIDTYEISDLKLLEDFVTSLVPAMPSSEAAQKLHRLCQLMCSIARFYVGARDQQEANESMRPIGDQFEMYLGELGFMNVDQVAPPFHASSVDPGDPFNPQDHEPSSVQMVDWFSTNRNMLSLLEEDLQDIDPIPWNL
ncbi:related to C6 transcription factor [Cephalotrichum gorgonifer]|uniref:Related to C6 transcription factor n=1 Tax=Cephalotrichum gorgonifer TaxID=2041049 RepID=A0AAE8N6T2_9PEZI|nr:related to C6 transcription factor [Cephalotrichum gorgonifer]